MCDIISVDKNVVYTNDNYFNDWHAQLGASFKNGETSFAQLDTERI